MTYIAAALATLNVAFLIQPWLDNFRELPVGTVTSRGIIVDIDANTLDD